MGWTRDKLGKGSTVDFLIHGALFIFLLYLVASLASFWVLSLKSNEWFLYSEDKAVYAIMIGSTIALIAILFALFYHLLFFLPFAWKSGIAFITSFYTSFAIHSSEYKSRRKSFR